jgi:hypothetical protein
MMPFKNFKAFRPVQFWRKSIDGHYFWTGESHETILLTKFYYRYKLSLFSACTLVFSLLCGLSEEIYYFSTIKTENIFLVIIKFSFHRFLYYKYDNYQTGIIKRRISRLTWISKIFISSYNLASSWPFCMHNSTNVLFGHYMYI